MRNRFWWKQLLIMGLTAGFAVGCASTPQQPQQQPTQQEQQQQGPSAATVQAINDARSALDSAKAAGCKDWQGIADTISQAETAAANGNDSKAQQLAGQAQSNAQQCEKQAKEAAAKAAAHTTYTVVRGDNLWDIAKKPSIYGNPYEWPLIYKDNSGKIKDPDLIYPGQQFDINKSPSQDAVQRAEYHAKHRGPWKLGVTEQSDKAYLAGK
ncbi:MAG TPA: LysM peptidoglycan-binding domain-containing protein [Gammaproteobacteria bacterium]|nr:LysM peptidoglycan-binding domain-containing protein [Gammaproteobacteria bacterium]